MGLTVADLGKEKSQSLEGMFGASGIEGKRTGLTVVGLTDKQVEETVTGLVKTGGA